MIISRCIDCGNRMMVSEYKPRQLCIECQDIEYYKHGVSNDS